MGQGARNNGVGTANDVKRWQIETLGVVEACMRGIIADESTNHHREVECQWVALTGCSDGRAQPNQQCRERSALTEAEDAVEALFGEQRNGPIPGDRPALVAVIHGVPPAEITTRQ